jgi:hypothetical protein
MAKFRLVLTMLDLFRAGRLEPFNQ